MGSVRYNDTLVETAEVHLDISPKNQLLCNCLWTAGSYIPGFKTLRETFLRTRHLTHQPHFILLNHVGVKQNKNDQR